MTDLGPIEQNPDALAKAFTASHVGWQASVVTVPDGTSLPAILFQFRHRDQVQAVNLVLDPASMRAFAAGMRTVVYEANAAAGGSPAPRPPGQRSGKRRRR